MFKNIFFLISLFLFLLFGGCGKKGEEETVEKTKEQVNKEESTDEENESDENKSDYDEFEKGMKEFEKVMKGNSKVEVVNFRKLKELLPEELDGMKRTSSSGEKTNSFGIKVSQAEGEYNSEDNRQSINIKIIDLGSMKGLAGMTAFAWSWAEIDKETDNGYEKTFEYKGHKAYEKYNSEYKNGEVQVMVAKRFMVEIKGNDVPMEAIHSALDKIDLDALSNMKDEGKSD
ncbi:hypothetical protein BMS3Abin03_02183 [bacterium BMS3Abin03]|nr:hypothetical protein BMS3Abin03_02183 [bacterium BMS3Abin03]